MAFGRNIRVQQLRDSVNCKPTTDCNDANVIAKLLVYRSLVVRLFNAFSAPENRVKHIEIIRSIRNSPGEMPQYVFGTTENWPQPPDKTINLFAKRALVPLGFSS